MQIEGSYAVAAKAALGEHLVSYLLLQVYATLACTARVVSNGSQPHASSHLAPRVTSYLQQAHSSKLFAVLAARSSSYSSVIAQWERDRVAPDERNRAGLRGGNCSRVQVRKQTDG